MIALEDYKKIFNENLLIMSRTASGIVDVSASATKKDVMLLSGGDKAKEVVHHNMDKALVFLYENKNREFLGEKELGDFIIKLAGVVNEGIVKSGNLFRSGADSLKYNYTKIADIPDIWEWFLKTFRWLLGSDSFEAYEIAAFCEVIINSRGHFFADGCGKISMLMALYVFMRHDLPGVRYLSRNEYYEIVSGVFNGQSVNKESLKHILSDYGFWNFVNYYGSLCDYKSLNLYHKREKDAFVIGLKGSVSDENFFKLKKYLWDFYDENKDVEVIFDCKYLVDLCSAGAHFFRSLKLEGKKFTFINVGYECEISLFVEKLWDCIKDKRKLPKIKVSDDMIIGEGFNGKTYRINDEIIAKSFKKESYYDDMRRERQLLRNALIHGISAPFSFGYGIVGDEIVLLMELLNSGTYMNLLVEGDDEYKKHLESYVKLVRQLHDDRSEEKFKLFPVGTYEKSVLDKADKIDELLDLKYRGRARNIIEKIDEPYGLIHGDIQPGNVMFSKDEMIFIDFDTFCVDKIIYDYSALYLTLLMGYVVGEKPKHGVIKLQYEKAKRFWNDFIERIYVDKTCEEKEKSLKLIRLIAAVRYVYLVKKQDNDFDRLKKYVRYLEESIADII